MIITDVAKKILAKDSGAVGKSISQLFDLKGFSTELAKTLTEKALKQKDLVIEALAKEFSKFLSQINISEEAQKVLEVMTLNIEASINFKDKKPSGKSVHHTTVVKKHSAKKNRK